MNPEAPRASAHGMRPQAAAVGGVRGRPGLVVNRISAQKPRREITLEVGPSEFKRQLLFIAGKFSGLEIMLILKHLFRLTEPQRHAI